LDGAGRRLRVGNGLEEGVDIGPLIDHPAIEKVEAHVRDAVEKGGYVTQGGDNLQAGQGYYSQPTVRAHAKDSTLCMNEETFGPVVPVASFENEEEAIKRANNTPFGLAAYVFTESISEAIRISEALEYGIIGLNDGSPSTPQAPFGGFKESGL